MGDGGGLYAVGVRWRVLACVRCACVRACVVRAVGVAKCRLLVAQCAGVNWENVQAL